MSQTDGIIANASGAAVRQDLNNALQALLSNSSGSTAPATTYAYQFWADTTAGQLKQRNSANDAWIVVAELDGIEENFVLRNKTAEDSDNGRESIISFEGTQSGGEISTLSSVEGNHSGQLNDTKGKLVFKTNNGSTLTTALSIDDQQHADFSFGSDVSIKLSGDSAQGNPPAIINLTAPTGIGSVATQQILGNLSTLKFKVSAGGAAATEVLSLASTHATFATSVSGTMRYETAVTATSGSLVEFNNLPSWTKKISVVGYGVSFTVENDSLAIRLKTSSGAITSNYRNTSVANYYTGAANTTLISRSITAIVYSFGIAATLRDFVHEFTNLPTTGNPHVWLSNGIMDTEYSSGTAYGNVTSGGVINTLSQVTGVQIFPTAGGAFDAGTMTVICEG